MLQARPTRLAQVNLKLLSKQDIQHVKDMVELRRRSNQLLSLIKKSRTVGFAPNINLAICTLNSGLEYLELTFLEHLQEEAPEALKDASADARQGEQKMSHQDPIVFCKIINLEHHQVLVKLDCEEETGKFRIHIITWLEFGEVATVLKLSTAELADAKCHLDWLNESQVKQSVNSLSEMFGLGRPYGVAA